MSIKGWIEKKIEEHKQLKEQRSVKRQIEKQMAAYVRGSDHDASKKGHRHKHGAGFITRFVMKVKGKKVVVYNHRPGYNTYVPSNHERTVYNRKQRDPLYGSY